MLTRNFPAESVKRVSIAKFSRRASLLPALLLAVVFASVVKLCKPRRAKSFEKKFTQISIFSRRRKRSRLSFAAFCFHSAVNFSHLSRRFRSLACSRVFAAGGFFANLVAFFPPLFFASRRIFRALPPRARRLIFYTNFLFRRRFDISLRFFARFLRLFRLKFALIRYRKRFRCRLKFAL